MEIYAPFLLGIILQFGSAVGVIITAPDGTDSQSRMSRYARAKDIDATQSIAALVTIVAAALVAPGLQVEVRSLIGATGAVLTPLVPWLIRRQTPVDWDHWTKVGLSPMNMLMIAFNLGACVLIWLSRDLGWFLPSGTN